MSLPDTTHAAALDAEVINPVFFAWLDIDGDPVRANTSGADITPTGTGDDDLDDFEFIGINAAFVDVSPVSVKAGGTDAVVARLSGIVGLDQDIIDLLDDPDNWRGREARLWKIIRNSSNVQQGGFHAYYTGRMVSLQHSGSSGEQTIAVTIESYLAAFSEASNRSYLDQARYDAGDLSAAASIAIANGNYTGAPTSSGGFGGGNVVPNNRGRQWGGY